METHPPLTPHETSSLQHYLTMLGATVLIPFLLVPAMGGNGQGECHLQRAHMAQSENVTMSAFFRL